MSLMIAFCVFLICTSIHVVVSQTDDQDVVALTALKQLWTNEPPTWNGVGDPCGNQWEGIVCNGTRVTSITLSSMGLKGILSGDIEELSELQTLDLSYNKGLEGTLPSAIGRLTKLTSLILVGCSFSGNLPDSLGSLSQLIFLHFGKNQLSGEVPSKLFHENMTLIHLLLDNNQFTGSIPTTIGLVKTLEVVDMSNNTFEVADIPSWFTELPSLTTLVVEKCQIEGMPPVSLFNLPQLQKVVLKRNKLSGTLDLGEAHSSQLQLVDLQFNNISSYTYRTEEKNVQLINQTFKPPPNYGPFVFEADEYSTFSEEPGKGTESKKPFSTGGIIGVAIGAAFLLALLCIVAIICCRKRKPKTVEHTDRSGIVPSSTDSTLELTGSRVFSLEDVKKITNNFSQANEIGSGAYGKVYRGTLPTGRLVAVKRAEQGSIQSGIEYKSEIELLSRVHHKNLVSLLGFCSDKGELILIYEFVPNGTLKGSLSGKSGIHLDWRRRIKVAHGASRGLAYLHELANPPIIHRDVKSNNILLDENLNAKVSDFGLSKSLTDPAKGHTITEVKGTMGYLDPEYYMTQRLSEKSDVYSFGVLLLELITGKSPIDRGIYIVREVRNTMNRTEDLYGLHELLDQGIGLGTTLKGFKKYVSLALWCVEESGEDRPAMGEVVKQLEDILEMAGLNPYSDSATSSATFDRKSPRHLYADESLNSHSGAFPR